MNISAVSYDFMLLLVVAYEDGTEGTRDRLADKAAMNPCRYMDACQLAE